VNTLTDVGDEVSFEAECNDCHTPFPRVAAERARQGERVPCPACGSTAVLMKLAVSETIHVHERLDLKGRRPGERRPYIEQRVGDDQHRKTGKWNKVRRVIDRDNNRYQEYVRGPDDEVIREVDVPLDEHLGHGSDSSQPKAHP
jgi:DNA-directed RNA polymerase subunit RPC12/RpoP